MRCPECGVKPIFMPWWRVRRISDWFTPLDGCPQCGYPYEREQGYFLMAIWAIAYGVGSVVGIILYGVFEWFFDWPIEVLLLAVLVPVFVFNFLFARHAKAYFLALDHFCDPHQKRNDSEGNGEGDDDGGGNQPRKPVKPVEPEGVLR